MSRQEKTRKEPERLNPGRWRSMETLRRLGDFIAAFLAIQTVAELWADDFGRENFAALMLVTKSLGRLDLPTNERELLEKPPVLGGRPFFAWDRSERSR